MYHLNLRKTVCSLFCKNFKKLVCILFLFSTFLLVAGESLVSPIFIERHSGKAYDPTRFVSDQQLEALIEAARWAPSSHNDQPWNFIIVDREKTPEAFQKVVQCLKPKMQPWVQKAPLVMIIVTRTHLLYKGKPNEWADYDTGAAAISMALQAVDLGLMAHQIGGFEIDHIIQAFQIPEGFKPQTLIVIGYQDVNEEPEAEPRTRRPIEENFFWGKWGK